MASKPRVLIVEDNVSWQDNYREALSDDYTVVTAGALLEAEDALDRQSFHVAVVDLNLSDDPNNRDGITVIRRLWELAEDTIVIVGSGYVEASMFNEFRELGVFGLTEISSSDRKQLASLIKGNISKQETPLEEVLNKVRLAARESLPLAVQRRRNASPFGIIRDASARDIQHDLRSGPMTTLRGFMEDLILPLFPWMHPKVTVPGNVSAGTVRLVIDGKTIGFETLCWCRALGHAVVVRFGRAETLAASQDFHVPGSVWNLPVDAVDLRWAQAGHFAGWVRRPREVDFHQYFDRPSSRRSLQSTESGDV